MPVKMGLIQELLPDSKKAGFKDAPDWGNDDKPWLVLSRDDSGLIAQISNKGLGQNNSFIHPSAIIGEFVKIEGGCYIGPGAEIRHGAYLRRGSWICDGALVGHSTEVKNSILLPGAKAPHFNYVGDSILGIDSNIGAGAKLSNVRNDRRNVLMTLKDGSRLDSGHRKLGALVGDSSQIGCNVVSNPGTIFPPNSMVGPNKTISGWFGLMS